MKYGNMVGICVIPCAFAAGAPGDELAKIIASDGAADDNYGAAVSASGTTAVVGSIADDDGADGAGSVYVYDLSTPTTPTEASKMTASDAEPFDLFGWSVVIDGGFAIVGSVLDDDNGLDSGSAYVFDVSNPLTPFERSKLVANDGAADDFFGWSVAMDGTTVVVGASQDGDNGHWSGSAYIFDISDPFLPVEKSKLLASDGLAEDNFGYAVGVDGGTVIVGAYGDSEGTLNGAGSVYLYDITDPASPIEASRMVASDPGRADQYGFSVAISGGLAITGAFNDDVFGLGSGSVYVLDVSDPYNPVQLSKITPSDGEAGEGFGWSVALEGTTALIGAAYDDDNGFFSGSAYLYDLSNPASPSLIKKLKASDGASNDVFGYTVALGGSAAVVGAYLDTNTNGSDAGGAYVYEVTPAPCDGDVNGDGVVDVNDISYVLFRLGGACPPCDGDANGDGVIDVNDISYVLFRLGTCNQNVQPAPAASR